MKSYKNLVPILLAVLMTISAYSLINGAASKSKEYNGYLSKAREYAEKGIVVDAIVQYENAKAMKDSIELNLEIAQMYVDNNMPSEAISWAEIIVSNFPKDSRSYEFILDCYIRYDEFTECYEYIEIAEKRDVMSKKIQEISDSIAYKYEIGYREYQDVSVFSYGLCPVLKDDKWGFASDEGKLTISNYYDKVTAFASEVSAVKDTEGNVYFIDSAGYKKYVIPSDIKCEDVGIISSGMVAISDGKKYSYYSDSFEKLFGSYDYAGAINGGIGAVKEGESWYLINDEGKKINKNAFSDVIVDEKEIAYRNERAFVKNGDKYIMVDEKAKQIGNLSFDTAMVFRETAPAAVCINGKWGFVDKNGKIVIDPQFDDARSFSNGLAAVCKGGKWGFIDLNGKTCIDFEFDGAKDFTDTGSAFIKDGDSWLIIQLYSKKD